MKATKVLELLQAKPDLANYFGVSDNMDLNALFGSGSLTGARPTHPFVWFWGVDCPLPCPDAVYKVVGNSRIFVFALD